MIQIHCPKCKKYTENKNPKVSRTFNGKIMLAAEELKVSYFYNGG